MISVHSIRVFFAKINGFLSGIPYREPGEPARVYTLGDLDEDLLFGGRNRWFNKLYWSIYRGVRDTWQFPRRAYRETKWFIQRGRRSWADCVTWSLDWYINGWMPDALRYFKTHLHGTPMSVFPVGARFTKPCGNPTDEASEIAAQRWNEILDKIIAGFEASHRILDGMYEKELGGYPMRRPEGVSKAEWAKVHTDRIAAERLLAERDAKIMDEGFALFREHYHSLWD